MRQPPVPTQLRLLSLAVSLGRLLGALEAAGASSYDDTPRPAAAAARSAQTRADRRTAASRCRCRAS